MVEAFETHCLEFRLMVVVVVNCMGFLKRFWQTGVLEVIHNMETTGGISFTLNFLSSKSACVMYLVLIVFNF